MNRKQDAVNLSTVQSIPLRQQFRELRFAAPTVAAPIRRAAAARA